MARIKETDGINWKEVAVDAFASAAVKAKAQKKLRKLIEEENCRTDDYVRRYLDTIFSPHNERN